MNSDISNRKSRRFLCEVCHENVSKYVLKEKFGEKDIVICEECLLELDEYTLDKLEVLL